MELPQPVGLQRVICRKCGVEKYRFEMSSSKYFSKLCKVCRNIQAKRLKAKESIMIPKRMQNFGIQKEG